MLPNRVENTPRPVRDMLEVVNKVLICATPPVKEDTSMVLTEAPPIVMVLPARVDITVKVCAVCVPVERLEISAKRPRAVEVARDRTPMLLPARVESCRKLVKVEPTFKFEFSVRLFVRMLSPINVE